MPNEFTVEEVEKIMKKFPGMMRSLTVKLKGVIIFLEALIAIAMLVMVVLSFKDLILMILEAVKTDAGKSYDLVQNILAHTLLLVIAIELSTMLIHHSPSGVLEVALYAVAKKMLISSGSTLDLLIGALAIAVIFATDKYLHTDAKIGLLFKMSDETEQNGD